ncbi:MAG: c-type cytochrome [Planctomycetes bacterium]|nr:c-type cytochrome [Planctomycetota bacterium]
MTTRFFPCGAIALLLTTLCNGLPASVAATLDTALVPVPQEPGPAAKKKPVRVNYDLAKQLFGTEPAAPAAKVESSKEKVDLGKSLYEAKLGKAQQSCASCHDVAKYGQDGAVHDRNTLSTVNAARHYAQFWDARAASVEDAAVIAPKNGVEHGVGDEAEVLASLQASADLGKAFAAAFPGDANAVSVANFRVAIGAYLRTLVTKSKFDAYLDGDQKALSNDEKLGLKLFMDTGCITCHTTRLLGGHMIQKSGLLKPYPTEDTGRMRLSGSEADKGFFKVPTLLNVEKTAPYYHDGKVATLEDAVTHMADMQLNKQLPPDDVAAIVAFLKTLTGPLPGAIDARDEKKQ